MVKLFVSKINILGKTLIILFLSLFISISLFSHLSRESLKCLNSPAYFPRSGIYFNRNAADDIAYLNADMLRIEFIRESDNSIYYPAYEYITDMAGMRGMKILGLIDYQSIKWSSTDEWSTDEFRLRFTNRITEIVSHFYNRANPIKHWEIWNEEDINVSGFNVRIEPEPCAKILVDAYHSIKAIDPEAIVVLGGLSPKGFEYSENYLSDLYNTTTLKNHYTTYNYHPFDVVACHPYPETFTNPNPGLANVLNQRIKAVMNANHDRLKKVWLTELGWNSYYVSETQQANYLRRSYGLLDTLVDPAYPSDPPYVERYFWFTYDDFGSSDFWGLVKSNFNLKKPAYYEYLNLTDPGPEPTWDDLNIGEDPPVLGSSDAVLPYQVSNSDLLEGKMGTIISGGFHSANVGNVSNLTNGIFDSNACTLVLADYAKPALHIQYTFNTPINITEIRMFAGHTNDIGNRAFQSNDIYINDSLIFTDITSGNYGQSAPGDYAVSLVRLLPQEGDTYIASGVTKLDILFWCVSAIGDGFRDRWSPIEDPMWDIDGSYPAYVAPIMKEIDVLGTTQSDISNEMWMIY